MDFICQVCDRSLIENPDEYQHYFLITNKWT